MSSRDKRVARIERELVARRWLPLRRATHGMLWRTPQGTTYLLASKFTRERDYLNARAGLRRLGVEIT